VVAKGGSGAKKEVSEAAALILSKSARDLKKRDLFNAAKGVSQVPAMIDPLNGGSQGSPRPVLDSKSLNKDLNLKGVISKGKDPIRSSHISKQHSNKP